MKSFTPLLSILRALHKSISSPVTSNDLRMLLSIARITSSYSKSTKLRVGCLIYDTHLRTIVSMGYNGTPAGTSNIMENNNNTSLPSVIHAEVNAINKLSWWQRTFVSHRYALIVTHSCCSSCANAITKSTNIRQIYYMDVYKSLAGMQHLRNHFSKHNIQNIVSRVVLQ